MGLKLACPGMSAFSSYLQNSLAFQAWADMQKCWSGLERLGQARQMGGARSE